MIVCGFSLCYLILVALKNVENDKKKKLKRKKFFSKRIFWLKLKTNERNEIFKFVYIFVCCFVFVYFCCCWLYFHFYIWKFKKKMRRIEEDALIQQQPTKIYYNIPYNKTEHVEAREKSIRNRNKQHNSSRKWRIFFKKKEDNNNKNVWLKIILTV